MSKKIQHRTFNPKHIQQHFADASKFYNYWAKATESKAAQKALEFADISGNESILEVGVGTGLLFEKIVTKNVQGFTIGIDLSAVMLEKAEHRMAPWKSTRDLILQQASAYDLPFEHETFDCLISCYMLDLLPQEDFVEILKEFKKVMKSEGRLVLSSMTFGSKWYHHFWEWMTSTFPDLMTDCRPVELEPFVKQAGFEVKKMERISQHTFPSQIIKAKKTGREVR